MKRRRRCTRKKTITVLQKYGPAKKKRVCASYSGVARKGGKRRTLHCVFKGKGKRAAKQSCHTSKRAATHAAAGLRKTCRARIRVRKVRNA